MNARLRAAVTAAEQLPDEIQAEIAEVIEEEIAELAWKASLNDPRSQAVLDELEAQLDAEIALAKSMTIGTKTTRINRHEVAHFEAVFATLSKTTKRCATPSVWGISPISAWFESSRAEL